MVLHISRGYREQTFGEPGLKRLVVALNLVLLFEAIFVFRRFWPPLKANEGHKDGVKNGEKLGGGIQTLRYQFCFQQHCSRQNTVIPLLLIDPFSETGYLPDESLPKLVSSRRGVDAGRTAARKSIRGKVGLAFRLGSVELAVGAEKLFPCFDVSDCTKLV